MQMTVSDIFDIKISFDKIFLLSYEELINFIKCLYLNLKVTILLIHQVSCIKDIFL